MNPEKRQRILVGVMVAMLALGAMWSISFMYAQKARSEFQSDELARCNKYANAISAAKQKPKLAAAKDIGSHEMGRTVERALQKARLSSGILKSVSPQAARRIKKSAYLQKPTALSLKNLSLSQLVMFLYHITDGTGMSVDSLKLTESRGGKSLDAWDVDLTLAYLIYSPISKNKRNY